MTEQFIFFVQRTCGTFKTEFTVNITEPRNPETVSKDHDKKEEPSNRETIEQKRAEGRGFKVAVIAAVVSGFIIVIMPIIYKMKQNYKQKRTFLDNRQEVV